MGDTVLVVGGGGREHALAWALTRSPRVQEVLVAPGNAGTFMAAGCRNVNVGANDLDGIVSLASSEQVSLVVVGPEDPLVAGLVDRLDAEGIRAFGPSAAAARLEGSKSHCKDFLLRHGIPTAAAATFHDHEAALAHLDGLAAVPVVKASGLAAGKGVIVAETKDEARVAIGEILLDGRFGAAGDEVLLEERLFGPEVSVLAFCDGVDFEMMPAAADHKRLGVGDVGPNTGGMGAFHPSPVADEALLQRIAKEVFAPTFRAMIDEGRPYRGVLYAGMMLTEAGPNVIEFNCRFGDPETQVVLSLLDSDLLAIFDACIDGHLAEVDIRWADRAAVAVVMATAGYPVASTEPVPISGLDAAGDGCVVFHAGTRIVDGRPHTAGGRVLAVSAVRDTLDEAADAAHEGVAAISFRGAQHRHDIARGSADVDRAGKRGGGHKATYRDAGVDIDAGNRTVRLLADVVKATRTPSVLSEVGAFGGLFAADDLGPGKVLVASTDGVGTKVELAARHQRWRGVGTDLVNHCVDDILVQGARPLFFLDYIATAVLVPEVVAEIVTGMAEACQAVGCALLGGETAEMPGVYLPGAVDVAGTIVGVVDRDRLWPRTDALVVGDLLIGLASQSPHTNGYSLIRRLLEEHEPTDEMLDWLLTPHRSYLADVDQLQAAGVVPKALAHITGGGLFENVPRVLPARLGARFELGSWEVPAAFRSLVEWGDIPDAEAFRVWNMGVGMVIVVGAEQRGLVTELGLSIIGGLVVAEAGDERVALVGSWR